MVMILCHHYTQTHPNVDKKLFTNESVIGLKQANRSFPINSDIGVLKWRLQTVDEALLPLSSECDDVMVCINKRCVC